ncbi:hypothetical protein [Streptomyces chumphonensis]|uniref:hypothetical protein n=1 Tax=Streptomyces chumphonensis TaxID=1214925 RepID=UPI003D702480
MSTARCKIVYESPRREWQMNVSASWSRRRRLEVSATVVRDGRWPFPRVDHVIGGGEWRSG